MQKRTDWHIHRHWHSCSPQTIFLGGTYEALPRISLQFCKNINDGLFGIWVLALPIVCRHRRYDLLALMNREFLDDPSVRQGNRCSQWEYIVFLSFSEEMICIWMEAKSLL